MAREQNADKSASEGALARFGLALAGWSERWFPDPLVFALLGIVFVFATGMALHEPARNLAIQGGKSFWALIPFTIPQLAWSAPAPRYTHGVLAKFAKLVSSASVGAVTDPRVAAE